MEYPLYEGDIRLEHPEIREDQTGDTFPCPPTYGVVEIPAQPTNELNTYEYYSMDTPVPPGHPSNTSSNNNWQVVWVKKTMSDGEIERFNLMMEERRRIRQQEKANTANTGG